MTTWRGGCKPLSGVLDIGPPRPAELATKYAYRMGPVLIWWSCLNGCQVDCDASLDRPGHPQAIPHLPRQGGRRHITPTRVLIP